MFHHTPFDKGAGATTPNTSTCHSIPGWKSSGTGVNASTLGPAPLTTAATPTERNAATSDAVPGIASAR